MALCALAKAHSRSSQAPDLESVGEAWRSRTFRGSAARLPPCEHRGSDREMSLKTSHPKVTNPNEKGNPLYIAVPALRGIQIKILFHDTHSKQNIT